MEVVWTFLLSSILSLLSPSLRETTRYRLKYCLKGSLSPKTTNQPTGHFLVSYFVFLSVYRVSLFSPHYPFCYCVLHSVRLQISEFLFSPHFLVSYFVLLSVHLQVSLFSPHYLVSFVFCFLFTFRFQSFCFLLTFLSLTLLFFLFTFKFLCFLLTI